MVIVIDNEPMDYVPDSLEEFFESYPSIGRGAQFDVNWLDILIVNFPNAPKQFKAANIISSTYSNDYALLFRWSQWGINYHISHKHVEGSSTIYQTTSTGYIRL